MQDLKSFIGHFQEFVLYPQDDSGRDGDWGVEMEYLEIYVFRQKDIMRFAFQKDLSGSFWVKWSCTAAGLVSASQNPVKMITTIKKKKVSKTHSCARYSQGCCPRSSM